MSLLFLTCNPGASALLRGRTVSPWSTQLPRGWRTVARRPDHSPSVLCLAPGLRRIFMLTKYRLKQKETNLVALPPRQPVCLTCAPFSVFAAAAIPPAKGLPLLDTRSSLATSPHPSHQHLPLLSDARFGNRPLLTPQPGRPTSALLVSHCPQSLSSSARFLPLLFLLSKPFHRHAWQDHQGPSWRCGSGLTRPIWDICHH